MKRNGTGRRRRLRGRRRAFQKAVMVAASQNAANQCSNSVLGLASAAQASVINRQLKARSTTVTMCHVKRTMPRVIEAGPNGVLGRLPLVRLGRTQRRPTAARPSARAAQLTAAIASSTHIARSSPVLPYCAVWSLPYGIVWSGRNPAQRPLTPDDWARIKTGLEFAPADRAEIALFANPNHPAVIRAVRRAAQRRIRLVSTTRRGRRPSEQLRFRTVAAFVRGGHRSSDPHR